jgi:hypothetical protein
VRQTTLRLGAKVDDAAQGGAGRFVVLAQPGASRVTVVDVAARKVARELDAGTEKFIVAVGLRYAFAVDTEHRRLRRWDLDRFEQTDVPLPPEVDAGDPARKAPVVLNAALGCAAEGPLLLVDGRRHSVFVDPRTLKVVRVRQIGRRDPDEFWNTAYVDLTAAPDGKTFFGSSSVLAQEPGILRFKGDAVECVQMGFPQDDRPRWRTADPLLHLAFQAAHERMKGRHLRAFAGCMTDRFVGATLDDRRRATFSLYSLATLERVLDLPPLEELAPVTEFAPYDPEPQDRRLTIAKRLFVVPQHGAILMIPPRGDDRVVVRPFDFGNAVAKAGGRHLEVARVELTTVTRGKKVSLQLATVPAGAGVTFKLESGPPGLTVSPTGRLEWPVPFDFPDAQVDVTIGASNASGPTARQTIAWDVK